MFRYAAVTALSLGLCLNVCHGQYVRIKIDLNKFPTMDKGNANAGFPQGGELPGGGGDLGEGGDPNAGAGGELEPGGGIPGFPGRMGSAAAANEKETPFWLDVWLPIKKGKLLPGQPVASFAWITHKWGTSLVPVKNFKYVNEASVSKKYKSLWGKLTEDDRSVEKLFSKAVWTLQRGMLKEFHEAMNELAKLDPKHRSVLAWKDVVSSMKKARQRIDPMAAPIVANLKEDGYREHTSQLGLYSLFTKVRRPTGAKSRADDPVGNRLRQLDKTYQKMYFWFALSGRVLPQPDYRLVAVLESTPKAFLDRHRFFSSKPKTDDGFTATRDNIAFLSLRPTSTGYTLLRENNLSLWQNYQTSMRLALSGKLTGFNSPASYAKVSTMALVQKVMEENSEQASASHQAARQLLIASDFLPANVTTAEWLRNGLASFFATPYYGPYEIAGLPNWSNLIYFKYYRKTGKLPDDAKSLVLLKVVSDRYLDQANLAFKILPKDLGIGDPALNKALQKRKLAQATAWALTYFLMYRNLDGIDRYIMELKKLPRDVEFDARVSVATFARAFGMTDEKAPTALAINRTALGGLANAWYKDMAAMTLDLRGIESAVWDDLIPRKKDDAKYKGNTGGYAPPPR